MTQAYSPFRLFITASILFSSSLVIANPNKPNENGLQDAENIELSEKEKKLGEDITPRAPTELTDRERKIEVVTRDPNLSAQEKQKKIRKIEKKWQKKEEKERAQKRKVGESQAETNYRDAVSGLLSGLQKDLKKDLSSEMTIGIRPLIKRTLLQKLEKQKVRNMVQLENLSQAIENNLSQWVPELRGSMDLITTLSEPAVPDEGFPKSIQKLKADIKKLKRLKSSISFDAIFNSSYMREEGDGELQPFVTKDRMESLISSLKSRESSTDKKAARDYKSAYEMLKAGTHNQLKDTSLNPLRKSLMRLLFSRISSSGTSTDLIDSFDVDLDRLFEQNSWAYAQVEGALSKLTELDPLNLSDDQLSSDIQNLLASLARAQDIRQGKIKSLNLSPNEIELARQYSGAYKDTEARALRWLTSYQRSDRNRKLVELYLHTQEGLRSFAASTRDDIRSAAIVTGRGIALVGGGAAWGIWQLGKGTVNGIARAARSGAQGTQRRHEIRSENTQDYKILREQIDRYLDRKDISTLRRRIVSSLAAKVHSPLNPLSLEGIYLEGYYRTLYFWGSVDVWVRTASRAYEDLNQTLIRLQDRNWVEWYGHASDADVALFNGYTEMLNRARQYLKPDKIQPDKWSNDGVATPEPDIEAIERLAELVFHQAREAKWTQFKAKSQKLLSSPWRKGRGLWRDFFHPQVSAVPTEAEQNEMANWGQDEQRYFDRFLERLQETQKTRNQEPAWLRGKAFELAKNYLVQTQPLRNQLKEQVTRQLQLEILRYLDAYFESLSIEATQGRLAGPCLTLSHIETVALDREKYTLYSKSSLEILQQAEAELKAVESKLFKEDYDSLFKANLKRNIKKLKKKMKSEQKYAKKVLDSNDWSLLEAKPPVDILQLARDQTEKELRDRPEEEQKKMAHEGEKFWAREENSRIVKEESQSHTRRQLERKMADTTHILREFRTLHCESLTIGEQKKLNLDRDATRVIEANQAFCVWVRSNQARGFQHGFIPIGEDLKKNPENPVELVIDEPSKVALEKARGAFILAYHLLPDQLDLSTRPAQCGFCEESISVDFVQKKDLFPDTPAIEDTLVQVPFQPFHKLSSCGHLCCLSCLEKWQDTKRGVETACPLCRKPIPYEETYFEKWKSKYGMSWRDLPVVNGRINLHSSLDGVTEEGAQ